MLQLSGITKTFDGQRVLDNVSMEVEQGKIVGLLGHNGSGKSTLLNIVSGAIAPDFGEVGLDGNIVKFLTVARARQVGIMLMSQNGALFPELSVLENIFAGAELSVRRLGIRFLCKREMRAEALALQERLGVQQISLGQPVFTLSQGQRSLIGFMRVLRLKPIILGLDEPTAALGYRERTAVNKIIKDIAVAGCGVILVSHILDDVLTLADQIVVLQRGRVVYAKPTSDSDRKSIIEALVE